MNTVRIVAIDYLKVNSDFVNMLPICRAYYDFDLPLTTATSSELSDLAAIRADLSNRLIGSTPVTTAQLNMAIKQYNALNIVVDGSHITGNPITSSTQIYFISTFANHLKFNPTDANIIDKATKAVWYICTKGCNDDGTVITFYDYPKFARPAVFLNSFLPDHVKGRFAYRLYNETNGFLGLFGADYDPNQVISTDTVYLNLDVLFAYADWFKTDDEKIRYLKSMKRYLERFLSYSKGKADGIKIDGLGYHHGATYDGYMYAYSTAAKVVRSLMDTGFQINKESYLRFREAVNTQVMYSGDDGVKAFAMAGRNPESKGSTLSSQTLSDLAISGGKILGLATADPILAGIYNRRYGVHSQFNYSSIRPFDEGYFQFNYGNLGVYRKDNWVAAMNGMTDQLFGAELYINKNRFGRYQSYGSLDILYPGNSSTGNGYSDQGWDWNYNPGATTIVLPWDKLWGEKSRIDEKNTYGFAGSLALKKAENSILSKISGETGLFSMRFKEKANQGFGDIYNPNTHNSTFEFTKTYFAIDNYIICLGSGIKNNDTVNPTVTTLSQRLNNNSNDLFVNGEVKSNQITESFSDTSSNWILDSYKTGYYISPNSGILKIRNSLQQTPYQNQTTPSAATIAGNNANNFRLVYLDHGTNPTDTSYEFVCLPGATAANMDDFAHLMETSKPYVVHENNPTSQIIEHTASKTWAYALPLTNTNITKGLVKANDTPCLVMCKSTSQDYEQILLSISNPDMGVNPSTPKNIRLTLKYEWILSANTNAIIVSSNATETVIEFTLADGLPIEINLEILTPCEGLHATEVPELDITQPTCDTATGSITVTSSIDDLSFGLDGTTFGNTTGIFEGLPEGNYTIYAKNSKGCISVAARANINSNPQTPLIPVLNIIQPTCGSAMGSINVTSSVADLSFGLDRTTFGNTTGIFGGLTEGSYTIFAKNSEGCISTAANAKINKQLEVPSTPILVLTQPINLTLKNGIKVVSPIAGLSFSLDGIAFENTTGEFEGLSPGNYSVYAKNTSGCISLAANVTISNSNLGLNTNVETLPFYAKINPNPSRFEFTLHIESKSNEKIEVLIYDIQGRLIKQIEKNTIQSTVFGEELTPGYYIVMVTQGANVEIIKLIKL